MPCRAATSLVLLAGAFACNGPAADAGFASSQPGPTSAPGGSSTGAAESSSSGGGETTASSEDSGTGTTEPLRDLGGEPDFGDGKPVGCKGKIDFLFLISRFGNMHTEQKQLLASFPGFIDTIKTMFPEFDTHIMVANPDGTWPGWACEKYLCKNDAPYCGENGKNYVCGPTSYELATDCDEVLGAGLLFNAGPYATNAPCALAGGRRYITREEPNALAAFECIATVGTYGPVPPTGDALIAALSPYLSVGECNKGFLRDDALLFITFISDSEDIKSKTTPADWYQAIVKAKHGDPGAVVTLLVTPQFMPDPPAGCTTDGDHENKLRDLITMFPYHVEGDTCALDYAPYFATAAKLVGEACATFVPQ
ncbi:MAG: hypothetical protein H0T76_16640 [Nannocystis sp.]|nr:hypothetical protein [Nannocystis sp.]MBA3548111.1 hypothetical protein [Nannocystis sp.]